MKKKIILTESQLIELIKKTVNEIELRENKQQLDEGLKDITAGVLIALSSLLGGKARAKEFGLINEEVTLTATTANTVASTATATFDITKPENIKKFQDYMDTVGPWVRQADGKFTKLNKGGGYGKFGPSTKAAWDKYQNDFKTKMSPELKPLQANKLSPSTGTTKVDQMTGAKVAAAQAAGTTPQAAGTTPQAAGTTPQATEIKTAEQIKKEFRQGKRNLNDLKKQREKLYNTYNKLSDKMSKQDQDSYLNKISELDNLIQSSPQA